VSRTLRWQVLLILCGMALAGILLTYLALTYVVVQVPAVGGTYVEGVAGTPHYINPLLSAYNEADQDLCALVFSGLTRFNSRGEVEPDLARSWDVSIDGLIYVFHLRGNARWHDGTPVTADDVLFTVGLLQDPDYPGPADVGAVWRALRAEKVDTYTVRFILAEPYAPFLDFTTVGLLPSHLLTGTRAADLPELEFNLQPVGSGPFEVQEVDITDGEVSSVLLARNASYYGSPPLLDYLRFRFYSSSAAAFRAYEAGEVEGVSQITLESLPRARQAADLELYSAQMAQTAVVFLNLGRPEELPFFQQVEVRQALLYGLDRQGLVERQLDGQGVVAHSPIVAGTWAYDDQVPQYGYDPARAAALLDGAGWPLLAGMSTRLQGTRTLSFTLLASADALQTAVAQEVARQWGELGVRATVVVTSPVALRQALEGRNYQALLITLALPGDPDPYPFWHQTQIAAGQNYAGWDHRRASEVLEAARVIVDPQRRRGLYQEFQTIFAQEVPAILLYHPVYTYGVDRRVYGVQIGPLMRPADRLATVNRWHVAWRRTIISQSEAGIH